MVAVLVVVVVVVVAAFVVVAAASVAPLCLVYIENTKTICLIYVYIMAQLLSGLFLSRKFIRELKVDVSKRRLATSPAPPPPCLVIIETGGTGMVNPVVCMCVKYAAEIGMLVHHNTYSATVTQDELLKQIKIVNEMKMVTGIFIVLPIVSINAIDANIIMDAVSVNKDVCGLHSINRCRLAHGDFSTFLPCTANACFELIKYSERRISGAHVVIYGRDIAIDSPLADILKWHNATVTLCHSNSSNIMAHTKSADILVVAIGSPEHVKGNWIKPGAVVIDCGNNMIPDDRKPSGHRIVGDVAFDEAIERASYLTVVPNGMVALSMALLLQNTIKAYFFNY